MDGVSQHMVRTDYRGARGANTGDDFHELWVLRQALTLLAQDTDLTAITVEGLSTEDESGAPQDAWDGVDCAFYFGSDSADSAERIVAEQVKYSAANPDQAWTVARLTHGTNKKKDNSVIGRLAKAFTLLAAKKTDLAASGKLVVRLVSNQPVDPAVASSLSSQDAQHLLDRRALQAASGLEDESFEQFAGSLDLSDCGRGSRFVLEECVLTTISNWTEDDARTAFNGLMRFVRSLMLPERKGEVITRESVLAQLGFSDPGALFPCPTAITRTAQLIQRDATQNILASILGGDQYICLHGTAGCGKTTSLQEIETLLPNGSTVVIYDCYGGGSYLDSDAYRHRPEDAFLQLSNDLARQLRIPLLLSRSDHLDYPRAFKKRLERAAEVVSAQSADALLVIAIDAADNAMIAAATLHLAEKSFFPDFVLLGTLPQNVRFIVTARTGRLSSLNLPHKFVMHEISGFTPAETAMHVQSRWNDAPAAWSEDFHYLSQGNPRVQRYALDYAVDDRARALDYLRPNGRSLDQVFQEQFEYAQHKVGHGQDIKNVCSGLIALPRPVPTSDLAGVTDLSEAHIRDICADLAPGIRLANCLVSFADEDFEYFVRSAADSNMESIQKKVAERFLGRHRSDAYAAVHLATALFAAGRRQEIIDLINTENEPKAIRDPVLRRQTQLGRLRFAMKVCRETGNNVDALLTLLIGAKAIKTEEVVRRLLIENPDLAASFARDTSSRLILRDPTLIEYHGPLLFHQMAADAQIGNNIAVREGTRQADAWMKRRTLDMQEQKSRYPKVRPHGWSIDVRDIAAQIEAILRTAGPQGAVDNLKRWSPKLLALQTASILSTKLIAAGEFELVGRCISEVEISTPWDLFLLTPLALAGQEVDLSRLESSLACLMRRNLIQLNRLGNAYGDMPAVAQNLDTILTACEVLIARDADHTCVIPVLERFADQEIRRRDRLNTAEVATLNLSLRAHALLERISGRKMTLESYWVNPPKPPENAVRDEIIRSERSDHEKQEELRRFVGSLIDLYDIRAQALLGSIASEDVETNLRSAIARYHSDDYRTDGQYNALAMRKAVALSLARLMALPGLDNATVYDCTKVLLRSGTNPVNFDEEILASFALDHKLHQKILADITARLEAMKNQKIAAEDKIEEYLRWARLLLPISFDDAKSLFHDAIDVAGEINVDVIHEIAVFAPLAESAISSMSADERRVVARDLAVVVGDAGVRLAGHDYFPWEKAAQALTFLDASFALAATARWQDSDIVSLHSFLPSVLETALSCNAMTAEQVSALSSLLDLFSTSLIGLIVDKARGRRAGSNVSVVAEHLAREELLRFGKGSRQTVSDRLSSLSSGDAPGYWVDQLARATAFHQTARAGQITEDDRYEDRRQKDTNETAMAGALAVIDWAAHRFTTEAEICDVVGRVQSAAQVSGTFVPTATILDRMGSVVGIRDRVAHLEALNPIACSQVPGYEQAQAVARRIDDWLTSPAVGRWCHQQLMQIIVNRLPDFSRWIDIGESPLPTLLNKCSIPSQEICASLLEGIERHVDTLSAPTIYALVGLISRYSDSRDTAQVIARFAERLIRRIPQAEQEYWSLNDIPVAIPSSIARFLFAIMGDIDVRMRWRAAYALRNIIHLGDSDVIDRFIELYEKTSEPTYRTSGAPFYWLAARLWFMIAVERIAGETPSAIVPHGMWLLGIAQDEELPHVLLRWFAKSATCTLVANGSLTLDPDQQVTLGKANTSLKPRVQVTESRHIGFNRYTGQGSENRRFHFDIMDTLPYWYSTALRVFVDAGETEFLDAAERWIVEKWGVVDNPWRWNDEPRKARLSDTNGGFQYARGHGSMPTLERFCTYLEWHAMWCTTGELIRSHALVESEEDNYHTFESWVSRNGLTLPLGWLSDLHRPKPLEEQFWFAPEKEIDLWVDAVVDTEFLAEMGLHGGTGMIVVGSYHDTRSRSFASEVRVNTALVSGNNAASLVRALQTIDDSWDFRIPAADDDLEIDELPYKLIGWLSHQMRDLGIEEHDPLRYDIHNIERHPSTEIIKALNLAFSIGSETKWIDTVSGKTVFLYEAWGDSQSDEREDRLRYDTNVRSSGWRLHIDKDSLITLLNDVGLDLIVEIEITRKNRGYDGYSRYDTETTKESRFDRILLLRADGTVEAAERHLGTWTVPRS